MFSLFGRVMIKIWDVTSAPLKFRPATFNLSQDLLHRIPKMFKHYKRKHLCVSIESRVESRLCSVRIDCLPFTSQQHGEWHRRVYTLCTAAYTHFRFTVSSWACQLTWAMSRIRTCWCGQDCRKRRNDNCCVRLSFLITLHQPSNPKTAVTGVYSSYFICKSTISWR